MRGRVRVWGERKNITKKLDILLKQKNQRESEGISHPVHLSLSLSLCISHPVFPISHLSLSLSVEIMFVWIWWVVDLQVSDWMFCFLIGHLPDFDIWFFIKCVYMPWKVINSDI